MIEVLNLKKIIAVALLAILVSSTFAAYAAVTAYPRQISKDQFMSYTSNANTTLPAWAFKGAYLNYTASIYQSFNNKSSLQNSYENYSIISVNTSNYTVEFTISDGFPGATPDHHFYSSYTGLILVPASSVSALNQIDSGKYPPAPNNLTQNYRINYESVNNTTVKVGFGSVSAKELTIHETFSNLAGNYFYSNTWVDPNTGIYLKTMLEIKQPINELYENTTLASTNILTKTHQNTYYLLGALAAAIVVIAAIALFVNGRRKSAINSPKEGDSKTQEHRSGTDSVMEARKQELRSLLDKGLITQEYFDDSVKRLSEK